VNACSADRQKPFGYGNQERKRLAGPRLRGGQQISSAERGRNCVALDWRGCLKVIGEKSLREILRNGELRKI
jgi:hypothetical protein